MVTYGKKRNVTRKINIGEFEKVGFQNELKFKLKSHILKMCLFVKKSFRTSVISRPNYVKPIEHSHGQSLIVSSPVSTKTESKNRSIFTKPDDQLDIDWLERPSLH